VLATLASKARLLYTISTGNRLFLAYIKKCNSQYFFWGLLNKVLCMCRKSTFFRSGLLSFFFSPFFCCGASECPVPLLAQKGTFVGTGYFDGLSNYLVLTIALYADRLKKVQENARAGGERRALQAVILAKYNELQVRLGKPLAASLGTVYDDAALGLSQYPRLNFDSFFAQTGITVHVQRYLLGAINQYAIQLKRAQECGDAEGAQSLESVIRASYREFSCVWVYSYDCVASCFMSAHGDEGFLGDEPLEEIVSNTRANLSDMNDQDYEEFKAHERDMLGMPCGHAI